MCVWPQGVEGPEQEAMGQEVAWAPEPAVMSLFRPRPESRDVCPSSDDIGGKVPPGDTPSSSQGRAGRSSGVTPHSLTHSPSRRGAHLHSLRSGTSGRLFTRGARSREGDWGPPTSAVSCPWTLAQAGWAWGDWVPRLGKHGHRQVTQRVVPFP